ncbi:HAD-IIB family hydrolase [Aneurinibacillus tyrosinisolvens]|uniref:HAD-IIB family hydrolase n=1 Tax=Aneurinibacillus tyrosinisolvens TaxID=1443435 RepID=UPI00063F6A8A|nr:HAD-IIB family hydrolase [Aneurinibacillus tyrosinisolvens]
MKPHSVTHLLATDLDGTLVGDADSLRRLLHYYEDEPYDVTLIYSTGRHLQSALSLIEEEGLPAPHILITDVGTEIYEGISGQPDRQWRAQITAQWFPERLAAAAASCKGLIPQDIPSRHRLSYTIQSEEPVRELEKKLAELQIPHKLIVSSGRDVDILPPNTGKGEALRYVLQSRGWQSANILVAGDSGNDHEMIALGYPAVIVGNAQQELYAMAEQPHIFRAVQYCAGGIHEAWEYFYGTSKAGVSK